MTSSELRKTWSSVVTWRTNGVEAKWGRSHNRPAIFIFHNEAWWLLDRSGLEAVCAGLDRGESLAEAVDSWLLLSDIFSIPA